MKDLFERLQPFLESDTGANGGGGNEGSEGQGESSDGKENTGQAENQNEHMIPKSRFDEVNNNYKSLKAELDALKGAQAEAETEAERKAREEAEQKGEFKNLYESTKAESERLSNDFTVAQERIETLESTINVLLEAKMATIDESFHELIPELAPEQKLAWVTNAEEKGLFGSKNNKQNEPVGGKSNPKGGSEAVDIDQLSPIQLMMSGYENK